MTQETRYNLNMSINYTVLTFTSLGDVAKIDGVWYSVDSSDCKVNCVNHPLSLRELYTLDLHNDDEKSL